MSPVPEVQQPVGADPQGTAVIPRVLTYEEWQRARGMSKKALGTAPFPAQPPVFKPDAAGRMGALKDGPAAAPRDVTRTPVDPTTRGKAQRGAEGVVGQIVNPVIEHPWMTAGVVGATMIPVVGPYVAGAMSGHMVSNIALYGYQRHLDSIGQPPVDADRVSGEAAIAQAIMLGIPVAHMGLKAGDVSAGVMEAGAKGLSEFKPSTDARVSVTWADAAKNSAFAAKMLKGAEEQGSPRNAEPVKGLESTPKNAARLTTNPRHPSGFSAENPFAPENVKVKPLETTSPAEQLQSTADTANDPMRPRRRPGIQTPEAAQTLGSVAQRSGLDVESNPFPPETPLHDAWKSGHVEASAQAEHVATAPLEPLPAYPEGYSAGSDLNAPSRIPEVAPVEGLRGNRPVGKVRGTDGPSVPPVEAPAVAASEPAPVSAPVAAEAAPAQAGGSLAPIDGTGDVATRGVSRGVEARALASGVAETLGELPKYRRANFEEHAAKALDLLATDPVLARDVALGNKPAPDGMIPEMVSAAVERKAIAEGDVATLRDLATSKLAEEGTTMGQRIAALGTRDPESPVHAIQDVIAARTADVKDIAKATDTEVAAIQDHIGKVVIDAPTWTTFVDSLRC